MGKKTKALHVRINYDLRKKFKEKAKSENQTRSKLIRKWIEDYINDK